MEPKVVHEREICIGCAACEAVCGKFWKMNGDGKVDLLGATQSDKIFELKIPQEETQINVDAAQACPVQCIHVLDKDGKKLI